jgi:hypothetical protein
VRGFLAVLTKHFRCLIQEKTRPSPEYHHVLV